MTTSGVTVTRNSQVVAIASLLVIVTISVVVTRVATSALELTGLSRELATFQARSAYTGVGFTTEEAEAVVAHPVRRRIVLNLMLLGNAGIASVVASLILGFVDDPARGAALVRLGVLSAGLALLWIATSSAHVNELLERVIRAALRRVQELEVRDYARLLNVAGPYSVQVLRAGGGGAGGRVARGHPLGGSEPHGRGHPRARHPAA